MYKSINRTREGKLMINKKEEKMKSNKESTEFIKDLSSGLAGIQELIVRLRDPEFGCPWDQLQSNKSLVMHTIEEAYEVAEAIESGTQNQACQELGDLLFNILFHIHIANEKKLFTLEDVLSGIIKKMIDRHPHVFGNLDVTTVEEVNSQWDKIKRKEKKVGPFGRMQKEFDDIASNLPALTHAFKIQKKVESIGFDWTHEHEIINKIYEEIDELIEAEDNKNKSTELEEYGDILFSVVNLGRHKGFDPETALRLANKKFINRFVSVETHLNKTGKTIQESNKSEMNLVWKKIKH